MAAGSLPWSSRTLPIFCSAFTRSASAWSVEICARARQEVGHGLVVDGLEDVETLNLSELVVEVAQHEVDQRLGLPLPLLGRDARIPCADRQSRRDEHHDERTTRSPTSCAGCAAAARAA